MKPSFIEMISCKNTKSGLTKSLFFALFFLINVFSTSAQTAKVSISLKQATAKQLFKAIEKQSKYKFSYREAEVADKTNITIDSKDQSVSSILNKTLSSMQLQYVMEGNTIVITRKKATGKITTIEGSVKDANNEPLIGVSVILADNKMVGTITDLDGNFSMDDVPAGSKVLISYIGYRTQKLNATHMMQVVMSEATELLDEVVVVGYGSVKKSNLTGAVSSVKMDDIPKIGTTSVANTLVGRVPGLSIRQNSAAPDGEYDIVIRGAASTGAGNSPLYVIDGFPGGDINTINPNDIETVEVLKDASSTAIYGARAANGVILVNTKRGKKGTLNINFKASASAQKVTNPYEMVGAKEYMNLSNSFFKEEWLYKNKIAPYGNVDPNTITSKPSVAFTPDQIANAVNQTDWFDEITRTGFINEESVSINGGAENVRYLFSLNHFGQDGVIVNSGFEKFIGRVNLEIDMSKWLTTGISISGTQTISDKLVQSDGPLGTGMLKDAMMYPQYLPIYDEEGNYTINPDHSTIANPVSWKDVENRSNSFRTLINNFWLMKITNGLDFRVNWGVNNAFIKDSNFYPKTHLIGTNANTKASIKESRNTDYLLDATLTYKKDLFKNHRLTALAGYAYQKFTKEHLEGGNSDFITDVFGPNNLGAGGDLTKSVGSGKSVTKYLSYFGRINYDIMDKYLFTLTLRADGSDKFGKENQFGYFPSGAFAWRITEEDFMKGQDILSNLKLRLSLGQTGNAQIGGNAHGYYASGADYILGNGLITGVSENQLANPFLKWETTTEYNVGVDFGFFNNRLTVAAEYYYKQIADLLDERSVGSYYPVSSVADNLGITQSQGFEFQINSVNVTNKNFTWSTDLNLYNYKDQWKERNPYTILSVYQGNTDPLHIKWGYLSDGLIQVGEEVPHMPGAPAGSLKIKDINGWKKDDKGNYILDDKGNKQLSGVADEMIDDADKAIIQNEAPNLIFGLGNSFQFKGFDLNFFFYGELGREVYNETRMDFLRADRFRFSDNVTTDIFDQWSSTNQTGKYPSGLYPKYETATDFWVEKADFIRLKSLSLGYTLPKQILKGCFKRARFYVDAQNLFVLTNFTGSDPETDSFSAYPNQRTYSLGVELSF
jgi:TonB-linked SusC/RagA family outer membrane protein